MIIVSLKRSYPNLIADRRNSPNTTIVAWRLEGITRGEWPRMKPDTLEGYVDYVVGTYDDMIVAAYPFDEVELVDNNRMKLIESTSNPETKDSFENLFRDQYSSNRSLTPGEWLIGCPIPGGLWKQGESRGTRRYSLEAYIDDHPELNERINQDFGGRMGTNLVNHFATGSH